MDWNDDLDQLACELESDAFNDRFEQWCIDNDIEIEDVGIVERFEIMQEYRHILEEETSEDYHYY